MAYLAIALGSVIFLSLVALSYVYDVHYHNVAPYMDEIFHIPQAQHYCQGHYFHWDPKITTFPGLYLYTATVHNMLVGSVCTVDFLRKTNGFLAVISFVVYFLCRKRISCPGNADAFIISILLFMYPINAFYYPLFYTDTASTLSICTAYLLSLTSNNGWFWHLLLITIGSISILMRQTNAVWLLFIAGTSMISPLYTQQRLRLPMHDVSFSQLFEFIKALLNNIPSLLRHTWSLLLPVGMFIAFVIANGGNIVVGDKQHHRPVLHWAMPLHLFASHTLILLPEFLTDIWMCVRVFLDRHGIMMTTTAGSNEDPSSNQPILGTTGTTSFTNSNNSSSPPSSLSPSSKGSSSFNHKKKDILRAKFTSTIGAGARSQTTPSSSSSSSSITSSPTATSITTTTTTTSTTTSAKKIARSLSFTHVLESSPVALHIVGLSVIGYVLWYHCLSHPFLLADNRHYTFYIWARVLSKPYVRLALAPGYYLATLWSLHRLWKSQGTLWVLIYLVAVSLTLIPAHLLEPRYFTPGIIVAILHGSPITNKTSRVQFYISILFCGLINVVVIYIFLYRTFTWPDGSIARFLY